MGIGDDTLRVQKEQPLETFGGLDWREKEVDTEKDEEDIVGELRKQVVFLQGQLEERERTVEQLQGRIAKYSLGAHLHSTSRPMVNAATQTDRVSSTATGLVVFNRNC